MLELSHVGLTVTDLDRSIAFYRDVVGMKEESELRTHEVAHSGFQKLVDNPDAVVSAAYLTLGSFLLQLLQYTAGEGTTLDLHHNNVGNPHLCFYVPDLEAKFDELRRRGDVTITSEITELSATTRSFYVEDPDGVPIEFFPHPVTLPEPREGVHALALSPRR
jgi:catechol 2,3-dioxygenase-like lactoylglutathione lyase family enzyme